MSIKIEKRDSKESLKRLFVVFPLDELSEKLCIDLGSFHHAVERNNVNGIRRSDGRDIQDRGNSCVFRDFFLYFSCNLP